MAPTRTLRRKRFSQNRPPERPNPPRRPLRPRAGHRLISRVKSPKVEFTRLKDCRNLDAKNRSVVDRRLPYQWPIDTEVLMHENIAQAHDILPRHGTVSRLKTATQSRNRLSNTRQPLCDGVTKSFIGHET